MAAHETVSPWFKGEGTLGLPLDANVLRRALGPKVEMNAELRHRVHGTKYDYLLPALLTVWRKAQADYNGLQREGIGPVRPRFYLGTIGVGLIVPRPGVLKAMQRAANDRKDLPVVLDLKGEAHVIPLAIYNDMQFLPLSEDESKGLVAKATNPSNQNGRVSPPAEFAQVAGGARPEQVASIQPPPPPAEEGATARKAAVGIGAAAIAAAAVAAVVALT